MKVCATGPAIRRRGNNGERVQTQWQAERQRGTIYPMQRPSVWARLFGRA
jgi:hypothetical protein